MALAVLHQEGAVIAAARVGLGGVEAVPRRIAAAEALLQGEVAGSEVFKAAAAAAAAAVDPLEDPQTDAQYRRELTHAMVYRALMRACPPSGAQG
jgi:carbon-monoxide dehydrogenase medium subunit